MMERTGTIEAMEMRMAAVDMWRLGVWQMIDGGSMTDRCIPAETVTRWHECIANSDKQ